MRWSDHDAVSEVLLAAAVVNENGSRDDRGRSYTVALLNDRLHVVCRQHFEGGALRGPRDGVRVFPQIEWAVGSLLSPVVADRLGNSQDVRFGKCCMQGRTPVSTGAKADQLTGIMQVGTTREVLFLQASHVHQQLLRSRLASERRDCCFARFGSYQPSCYGTGHGCTFQISAAYSAIVRSLENFPELATLRIALRAHSPGSAYNAQSCSCVWQ